MNDLYARAQAKLDAMGGSMAYGDWQVTLRLLSALLEERQASPTCRKCRGSGTISVKHGMIFDTDSKDEVADAFHEEPCDCRKAADAALLDFLGGADAV